METRSNSGVTVVKMPRTSYRVGWRRSAWSAHAESLPLDHETKTGVIGISTIDNSKVEHSQVSKFDFQRRILHLTICLIIQC